MSDSTNPYQPPKSRVDDIGAGANENAAAIRREHLKHEASIRSIGSLYLLGAILLVFAMFAIFFAPASGSSPSAGLAIVVLGLQSALALAAGYVGLGLRKLRAWTRIPASLLAAIGLLGFPIGTLINAYFLWLLLSKKGRFILSDEYAGVVEATPDIKYKTSIVVWILLGLIVLMFAAAILLPMFAKR